MIETDKQADALLDQQLVERWQAGDERAASAIVERHASALARFAASLGVRDEVEELVQDTFVRAFGALYEILQDGGLAGEEPMLNILGFYTDGEWRIHVFPRAKHRPSFYDAEGDKKLLFSPAAVELGGVCTTPREPDFDKATREHIVQMYHEVSVSPERFAAITARLPPKLAALATGEALI